MYDSFNKQYANDLQRRKVVLRDAGHSYSLNTIALKKGERELGCAAARRAIPPRANTGVPRAFT
jgi:hypothetical protein